MKQQKILDLWETAEYYYQRGDFETALTLYARVQRLLDS